MTILVALAPGRRDNGALHLGAMLARSSPEDVLAVSVVPAPWPPDPYRADEEFLTLQESVAEATLDHAREHLGLGSSKVDTLVWRAPSASAGLLEVISKNEVSRVVVGSSSTGFLGRVMLGGVAERLLHSSAVPVAVSPRGFHVAPSTKVARISVGLGRADDASGLLTRAATAARESGIPLRVVCFAVRPMSSVAGGVKADAERLVIAEWVAQLKSDVAARLAESTTPAAGASTNGVDVDVVVGQGDTWGEAMHDVAWVDGDILVVGTSSTSLSQFFLGSHATKIVRNSPVPTILLPRA
jgi:nucleotide-binding universal stress UspA family protein